MTKSSRSNLRNPQRRRDSVPPPVIVTSVNVSYERTFNLGNYQSIKLGLSAWAGLSEEADVAEVIADLQNMVRSNVIIEAARMPQLKLNVEGVGRGLKLHELDELMEDGSSLDPDLEVTIKGNDEDGGEVGITIKRKQMSEADEVKALTDGKLNPIPNGERRI